MFSTTNYTTNINLLQHKRTNVQFLPPPIEAVESLHNDVEETAFLEDFVLQCDFDCSDPTLFLDGFVWHLSPSDFASVVRRLGRKQKEKSMSK